jgi:hypothetical protein
LYNGRTVTPKTILFQQKILFFYGDYSLLTAK